MNKISCNTCLDLMPLVKDGVSSKDSKKLVEEHLLECEDCKNTYSEFKHMEVEDLEIDNDKVLGRIKKKLYSLAGLILIVGSIIGVNLTNSQNIFYNFLIMPLLGGVAYLAFEKKAYLAAILVFIISFVRQASYGYLKGYFSNMKEVFYESVPISIVFVIFFFVGIIIFRLLTISIYGGKENKYEKNN